MSTAARVWKEICDRPQGEPFALAELLSIASRANLDQVCRRLVLAGKLQRVARGIYVRPKQSRFVGPVAPSLEAVVVAQARQRKEHIQVDGAEACRRLGLSLQVPVRPVFLTTGRSRRLRVGSTEVTLRRASRRKLALAGRPAGDALVALYSLGASGVTPEVLRHIEARLGPQEFQALAQELSSMPAWMAECLRLHGAEGAVA